MQCVAGVVEHAIRRIREDLMPWYPNVDGWLGFPTLMAAAWRSAHPAQPSRSGTVRNIARNPNFGGAPLVVGLGCEKMQPEWMLSDDRTAATGDDIVRLQDEPPSGQVQMSVPCSSVHLIRAIHVILSCFAAILRQQPAYPGDTQRPECDHSALSSATA